MSGGSHNYICYKLSNECEGRMYDTEMNDLVKDLFEVLHDLEWWQSGDYLEDQYRETLVKFKAKWFKGDRQERLMQADYEARLKADMAAMLTEIQLEIEESENCGKAFHLGLQMASNIIQQKINALRGNEDGK